LRTITWSNYDHIALILKYAGDPNIYLYESVDQIGVRINSWDQLRKSIGPDKFYSKAAFRHCNFDRSEIAAGNFGNFLD